MVAKGAVGLNGPVGPGKPSQKPGPYGGIASGPYGTTPGADVQYPAVAPPGAVGPRGPVYPGVNYDPATGIPTGDASNAQYPAPIGPGIGATPRFPVPKPQVNGLAAFANSPLGQLWGQVNAPQDYTAAFQTGLNAARSNIAQQLSGSLADIQNSQRQAEAALGQYAPMVNNDYAEGQAQNAAAAKASQSALAQYGIKPELAQANLAPENAAVAATHREDLANQSLLGTGIQQQAEHESALANLAAQQQYGNLDQAQMQLQGQMGLQQMANRQSMAMALLGGEQNAAAAAQQFGYNKSLQASSPTAANSSPATGPYATYGVTQGQVDQAHSSAEYHRIVTAINNAGGNKDQLIQGIATGLSSSNPNLLSVLQAENYIPKGVKLGPIG